MHDATEQTFASEVEQSTVPVLVEFHAQWCGPCKAIRPMLDQLAQKRSGSLKVVGVDFEHSPNVAVRYGVRTLPTLILFKGGKAVGQRTGAPASLGELEAMVDRALASHQ